MTDSANPRVRRRRNAALFVATVGGALACAQRVQAEDPAKRITIDASRCVELVSPEARLACYEAQVGAALGTDKAVQAGVAPDPSKEAPPPAQPAAGRSAQPAGRSAQPVAGRPAQPATEPSRAASVEPAIRIEEPSVRASRAERRSRSRKHAAEQEQTEITGTIAALREREPNQLVITLEDGQVWLQTAPEHYELSVGSEVRIRSSHWGQMYRLTDDALRGFILVKPVK